jgi:hypothetical protein
MPPLTGFIQPPQTPPRCALSGLSRDRSGHDRHPIFERPVFAFCETLWT